MYRGTGGKPDLPAEPNSFVGREHELDELRKLVFAGRMVTLAGPGGIGKTRLALHALHALADEFPDGVCYVELADVSGPDLVVSRIASVAGVTEEKDRPLLDTLADALRARSLVLALDNCEHLLDACAGIAQRLLAAAPDLRLVITSREPLRVAGETVWPVPPLALTSADGSAPEAVQLFADRAAASTPGFELTPASAAAAAAICQTLDGIPLAIELAAARVRALSVEQIRMRVADRFGLLTAGDRSAAPRQQTLRAAIDWSHDLLTEREQVLLRRLSVFAGWSLEMVEQVCTDDLMPSGAVLDTVAALVDKSLVVREPEVLGQARYRMLDTIREYAAEKLAVSAETAGLQDRFRDHILAVAERNFAVGMALVPAPWQDRVDVFRQYDADAGNVWLVLGTCLAAGDVTAGLRICTAVRPCLLVRGEYALGCEWLDAFLARPEAAGVDPRIRGQALIGRAQLTLPRDPAGAEKPARDGLDLCRAAGDEFWTATGLNLLSEIALHTGRPEEAETLSQEAAGTAEAAGDGWNAGWALGIRATIAGVRGNIRAAADLAGASIELMRSIDQQWGVARAQLGLGDLARLRGDFGGAQRQYADALGPLREIGARPEIARCLTGLGRVALDLGDTATARGYLGDSLRVSRDIGTRIGIARGLESCAMLADREGDPERAVLLAAASAGLRATAGLPRLPGSRADRYRAAADRLGGRGGTAAERLWEQGLALTPEAAVELALSRTLEPGRARPGSTTGSAVRAADPGGSDDSAAGAGAAGAAASSGAASGRPADSGAASLGPASPGPADGGPLTPRELEIAALIADGLSNKAVGAALFIAPATVARHVANIMFKLDFRSRAQIAAWITERR